QRYPEEPAAANVAQWLLTCFVSEEVTWQNLKQLGNDRRAKQGLESGVRRIAYQAQATHLPELKERLKKSQKLVQSLETRWPRLAASADVQFPLATLLRTRGLYPQAANVYRNWASRIEEQSTGPLAEVARREIWLAQQATEVPDGVASCYRTTTRPQL